MTIDVSVHESADTTVEICDALLYRTASQVVPILNRAPVSSRVPVWISVLEIESKTGPYDSSM